MFCWSMSAAAVNYLSTLTALKRQHPATNVMLLASSLEPALMLEGMRAGVTEVLAEPLRQADFDAAMTRLARAAQAGRWRSGLRLRRCERRRRHDHHGGQRRDRADEAVEGPGAARRPAPGLRRCGRLPRRRCAILAARRAREHASARRRVPEEPGRQDQLRPRAAGVRGPSGQPRGRHAAARFGRAARRVSVRLHRPGRPPFRPRPCSTVSIR